MFAMLYSRTPVQTTPGPKRPAPKLENPVYALFFRPSRKPSRRRGIPTTIFPTVLYIILLRVRLEPILTLRGGLSEFLVKIVVRIESIAAIPGLRCSFTLT
jgi:hypothetical protein